MHTVPPDPYWCFAADASHRAAGCGAAALAGDPVAGRAVWDYAYEFLEAEMTPFEVGSCYLIFTQTLYYVGRVAAVRGAFLVLEDASWVHWTGRLSTLVRKLSFAAGGWPAGDRRPRTEYVGTAIVALPGVISAVGGDWKLPKESVQA